MWLVVRSPDDADARGVRRVEQPAQRGVPTEQRVDAVEGDRVVAVVGPRLEDRGQVEQRRAEVAEVVEVRGDAVERAAVQLVRHVRAPGARPGRPSSAGCAHAGQRHAGLGALEPVGEDLVADLVGDPVGQPVLGADPEVRGVGDVALGARRRR